MRSVQAVASARCFSSKIQVWNNRIAAKNDLRQRFIDVEKRTALVVELFVEFQH